MTLQERIVQAEQQFNEYSRQRDDINTEMTKLQGEWRVLKELEAAETSPKKPNKKATTVEAVPEGEVA